MIDDIIIADAVVHPWDMSPENQNPEALQQIDAVYGSHKVSFDEAHAHYILQPDEFFRDIGFDLVARAEFVESPVDFAILHSLPNLGFGIRHITKPQKVAAFRDQYPHRTRMFGTVETPVVADAIEDLKWQIDNLGVDGVKLYPAFFYDNKGEGWRMDSQTWATPFLEAARGMGIKRVAIHKALWLEPAPKEAFDIDDLPSPLAHFPDMTFEMVHGGIAFLDQTIEMMHRYPNLYLTMESTFSYVLTRPRVFTKILGKLLTEVGSERLLFASGNNLTHPRPLLEAFMDFKVSDEHMQEFGVRQITEQDRRNILGLNTLKLHGVSPEQVKRDTADDAFARERAKGVPGPWSAYRDAG